MKSLSQPVKNALFHILDRFSLLLLALCLPSSLLAQSTLVPTAQTMVGTGSAG